MLVYGDHDETSDAGERLEWIARMLERARSSGPGLGRHSALTDALIEAGRLLQGIADADFAEAGVDRRSQAADEIGDFVSALAHSICASWDSSLADASELPSVPTPDDRRRLTLRGPEGFAFYAVYPEAYIQAARSLRLSAPPMVVGIRSIGTTLAAVAAAALNARPPITLRPFGDPYARRIAVAPELERELLGGDFHYVIADEGPGQSGSSFGAVADWLEERGVPRDRIAFLTSHSGPPGPQASECHRRRWAGAQRLAGDFGEKLADLVRGWASKVLGPIESMTDISAGEWRPFVYSGEAEWPAVNASMERRKYLAVAGGERFLVKFAGLGGIGERKLRMARVLHEGGFSPEPMGIAHGFFIERWNESARHLADCDKPLTEIADYIAFRARRFPAPPASGATIERLLEMCRRNVALGLGRWATAPLDRWASHAGALSGRVRPVRTDNKLDRHEWIRDRGRLLKTDALDHHAGHDLIGCQDSAWDVAGAIAEFGLDTAETARLVTATERALGRPLDAELLQFYRIAYPAFRLGLADLSPATDPGESARIADACNRYASQLRRLLKHSSAATRPECPVD